MENSKGTFQKSQQGSGSAENRGQDREHQVSKTDLSGKERQDISSGMGKDANRMTTIREMGGMSGRDDASGGSGDRMEDENTGEGTGR